jgi:hypothetical protein
MKNQNGIQSHAHGTLQIVRQYAPPFHRNLFVDRIDSIHSPEPPLNRAVFNFLFIRLAQKDNPGLQTGLIDFLLLIGERSEWI